MEKIYLEGKKTWDEEGGKKGRKRKKEGKKRSRSFLGVVIQRGFC